ncbi:Uncharacterised protein [Vibrio cholerae]|nr:Uncharacterised protein [Vibrio cholerae]
MVDKTRALFRRQLIFQLLDLFLQQFGFCRHFRHFGIMLCLLCVEVI